jgi:hypothetical protein
MNRRATACVLQRSAAKSKKKMHTRMRVRRSGRYHEEDEDEWAAASKKEERDRKGLDTRALWKA